MKLDAALASIVQAAELISTAPVVVISTSAAFPAIITPAAPSNVSEPADVVKLDVFAASNDIPAVVESIVIAPLASKSNVVELISHATSNPLPTIKLLEPSKTSISLLFPPILILNNRSLSEIVFCIIILSVVGSASIIVNSVF